ncbi:RnfABCDGE type electron transport complex subunit G [Flammeovirgaceae bacterium SG7u.111]|nr:RnfABCDGE type electron transport complex subunit G [Flammeovirgaceae bacterium SG7u.132]WPO34763.1 RnfABCDGE type electron transport complex subunit G [Flammeovirgaceae bacterium SG7u.111]
MAKRESNFANMVITLTLVTLISSALLGFVYEFTKEPIALAKLEKQKKAIAGVVPAFDSDPLTEMYKLPIPDSKDSLECYPAKQGGELVGTAIKTKSPRGYSGDIWIMVGFTPEGAINNIVVLEHKETPGLGSKMSTEKFLNQFLEKNPDTFKMTVGKDGGEVDAISGATISSRAFCEAVQLAYDIYKEGGQK